jgi:mannosyltransferase OCH1-like enzyme
MHLLDDSSTNTFIARHFDEAFVKAYNALPFGVMRADTFRCVIECSACNVR